LQWPKGPPGIRNPVPERVFDFVSSSLADGVKKEKKLLKSDWRKECVFNCLEGPMYDGFNRIEGGSLLAL